jgi:endonuclease YncB( thermonuclease family)
VHPGLEVVQAVDGDTVQVRVPGLPAPLDEQPLSVRVLGVDCPESGHRARCDVERRLAEAATAFTQTLVTTRSVGVEICGWDKYGGRVLGDLVLDGDERLSVLLLRGGYAVAYTGRGARHDWCPADECDAAL